jgi:hypothetical protein
MGRTSPLPEHPRIFHAFEVVDDVNGWAIARDTPIRSETGCVLGYVTTSS